jgi:hypothetical protein
MPREGCMLCQKVLLPLFLPQPHHEEYEWYTSLSVNLAGLHGLWRHHHTVY